MKPRPPLPPEDRDRTEIDEDAGPMPTQAPGNLPPVPMPTPVDPESALIELMTRREDNPMDLTLRDQEHEAFSRYMLHKLGPVLGPAVVGTSVPAYSGIKAAAQAMGGMKDATPASFQEVRAGLRPLWEAGFGSSRPIIDQTFKGLLQKPAVQVTSPPRSR